MKRFACRNKSVSQTSTLSLLTRSRTDAITTAPWWTGTRITYRRRKIGSASSTTSAEAQTDRLSRRIKTLFLLRMPSRGSTWSRSPRKSCKTRHRPRWRLSKIETCRLSTVSQFRRISGRTPSLIVRPIMFQSLRRTTRKQLSTSESKKLMRWGSSTWRRLSSGWCQICKRRFSRRMKRLIISPQRARDSRRLCSRVWHTSTLLARTAHLSWSTCKLRVNMHLADEKDLIWTRTQLSISTTEGPNQSQMVEYPLQRLLVAKASCSMTRATRTSKTTTRSFSSTVPSKSNQRNESDPWSSRWRTPRIFYLPLPFTS